MSGIQQTTDGAVDDSVDPFPFEEYRGSPELWQTIQDLRDVLATAEDVLATRYPGVDSTGHPVTIHLDRGPRSPEVTGLLWFDSERLRYQEVPRRPLEPKRLKAPVCPHCQQPRKLSKNAEKIRKQLRQQYETRLAEYDNRIKTPEPVQDVLAVTDTNVLCEAAKALPQVAIHLQEVRDLDPAEMRRSVQAVRAFLGLQ